jgi:tetratricopeptide (TPR) repeat protein
MTGEVDPHVPDLRAILMRHHDAMTSFMAAYNLGYAYELRKEHKKALFYGRIARDRAKASGNTAHLANSLNQIGNSLLAESYFADASQHYGQALALMGDEMSYLSVPALINEGYCRILRGRTREGFTLLFRCLRWLRPRQMRSHQTWTHLFLCAGYLEVGRVIRAWRHGRRALALAEQTGESDAIKASLFMMGEVERNGGDLEAAHDYFSQVQRRFFPEYSRIPELMSVVGMAEVVNLRA